MVPVHPDGRTFLSGPDGVAQACRLCLRSTGRLECLRCQFADRGKTWRYAAIFACTRFWKTRARLAAPRRTSRRRRQTQEGFNVNSRLPVAASINRSRC